MSESIMNPRLLTLLRFAKSERSGSTWSDVAQALGDLYHPEMTLADVMHHLVAAYSEVLCEPRFEVGRSGKASKNCCWPRSRGSTPSISLARAVSPPPIPSSSSTTLSFSISWAN